MRQSKLNVSQYKQQKRRVAHETETKSTNKVPVLGDLPIIGAAFRSSSRTSNKNELIIIVTPKILNDDEAIMERM